MSLRYLRHVRNALDLLVAWILWGPTRLSRMISLSTGMKRSTQPASASKPFERAMRLKFYRTAVEILVLSGISIPKETLSVLFQQCLTRAYFGRATLLAPRLTIEERKHLRAQLILVGEKLLADHIALMDGEAIDTDSAARTLRLASLQKRWQRRRRVLFAERLYWDSVRLSPQSKTGTSITRH